MALKYFETRIGDAGSAEDNPLSPHFVPLRQRTANQEARWWALHQRLFDRRGFAECSHEKAVDTNKVV